MFKLTMHLFSIKSLSDLLAWIFCARMYKFNDQWQQQLDNISDNWYCMKEYQKILTKPSIPLLYIASIMCCWICYKTVAELPFGKLFQIWQMVICWLFCCQIAIQSFRFKIKHKRNPRPTECTGNLFILMRFKCHTTSNCSLQRH